MTGPVTPGGIGDSAARPDGVAKVTGSFLYSSDLRAIGMLQAVTVRSPHPHAELLGIDITDALAEPGVRDVITHEQIPGRLLYGQMMVDQPVLARDVVRYHGEPVAVVAADDLAAARRGADRVRVSYRELPALTDPRVALRDDAVRVQPGGNLVRHVRIRRGDPPPHADVVVRGEYELGMQDQAFLGPESGLAVPAPDGGVDLYVATQWPHSDVEQLIASLALPRDLVRVHPAGVGGAFGAREDLSVHVHICLLALRTGRPVKMSYGREESFLGHVHRHPGVLRYEHGAGANGKLQYIRAEIVLDGGAYAASSPAVASNVAACGAGPYDVPSVDIEAHVVYTNNPPCGAMRGFGAVQACFAYEAQMDRLAAALGLHPVELRRRNAMAQGSVLPTGQTVDGPAPVADLLRRVHEAPMPAPAAPADRTGRDTLPPSGPPSAIVRGVGYAVGFKNVGFIEGFDDYSTAAVELRNRNGTAYATVTTAAAEVGQGLVTVQAQLVRSELGITDVTVLTADTRFGSAGPTSASRQTHVTGGAVRAASAAVRERVLALAARLLGRPAQGLALGGGQVVDEHGRQLVKIEEVLGDEVVQETREWRPRRTYPLSPATGQGDSVYQFSFAAHRAVVDVDVELGLVRVVELTTAQDVGKVINPRALLGQIHGGTVQGLGLALMEEIRVADGRVLDTSFADYLIPTILDVPPMRVEVLECADPHAPYGVRGAGEAPAISSTAAVAAAVRDATALPLTRVPIRSGDIIRGRADGRP